MGKATDILNRRKKYGSTYVNAEYDTAKNSTAALDILNNRRIDKLKKELNSVDIKSLYEYKDFGLSEDKKKEYKTTLSNYKSALESLKKYDLSFSDDKYNKILQDIDLLSNKFDVLSNYKTESEYNDALQILKTQDEMRDYDSVSGGASIEELKSKLSSLEKEKNDFDTSYKANGGWIPSSSNYNRPAQSQIGAYNEWNTKSSEYAKQIKDLENEIYQKERYHKEAVDLQEFEGFQGIIENRDFEEKSQKGLSRKNPSPNLVETIEKGEDGKWYTKGGFGKKKEIKNILTFVRDNADSLGNVRVNEDFQKLLKAGEDEVKRYSYLLEVDEKKAQRYLDLLMPTLLDKRSDDLKERLDVPVLKHIASVGQGLANYVDSVGIKDYSNDATMVAMQKLQSEAKGLDKFLMGAGTTVGNMLPSIVLSYFTSGLASGLGAAPKVASRIGSLTNASSVGISAKGSAYKQKIAEGWNPDDAEAYSTLIGVSEASLEAILSGIVGTTGFGAEDLLKKADMIDNALLRFTAKSSIRLGSEELEEIAQLFLEPTFEMIVKGGDYDQPTIDELIETAIVTAISTGTLNSPTSISEAVNTFKQAQLGRAIKDAGQARNLVDLGKSLGEETKSYEYANKITDKSRGLAISKLLGIVEGDIANANKGDIVKSLERKGYDTEKANNIADLMLNPENTMFANSRGISAPGQTYNDIINNPNSTVSQRNETYEGILRGVAENRTQRAKGTKTKVDSKPAATSQGVLPLASDYVEKRTEQLVASGIPIEQAKQVAQGEFAENQSKMSTRTEKAVESKFESNTEGKDFDTASGKIIVSKKLVSSAKDDMAFEVTYDDGTTETVDAKNISFGNDGEALVYSTVMDMNVPLGVAESLIGGYKGNDIKTAATYINGIREAFTFGKYNQEADLNNGQYASQLTDEQRNSAFKLGRIYANEKAIADTKAIVGESKPTDIKKREGKVHFEGDKLSLKSVQEVSIENLKVLTMAIGKDIHIFESYVDANGKRVYKDANGNIKKAPNGFYDQKDGSIWIDLNAGRNGEGTMMYTVAHELTHFIKQWSPTKFKALADFLVEQYGKEGVSVHQLVLDQQKKAKENGRNISYDVAFEEMVADSMETMLTDGKVIRELVHRDKGLFDKIKSWIDNLLRRLNKEYKNYSPETQEGQMLREMKKTFEKAQRLFADALTEASDNFAIKGTDKAFVENYLKTKDVVYNLRAAESHQEKLVENYTSDASIDLETLQKRYAKVIGIWEKLGGELNSKFLNEWNNKVGKDRAFTIFKAQAGYKYNVELSSMCKKGVPLFEAIDTIVKKEVMNELKTKTLGKAEKEILYDILKNHNFEIPCAICYVEQARQREGVIINDFLDGKIEKNAKGKVTKYKLGWNDVLNRVEKEMKKNGVDYTFRNVDKSIATDSYAPADIVMDEATQDAFYKALKKVANAEIVRWNREERKSNQKERRQITDLKPQTIKEVFKGTLPSNLKIFKVLFNNPSSRFKISRDLLYSSATTLNLANTHNDLYSLFNSQGGVADYKTKQAPVVYWGDILGKSWKPSTVRKEGGIRNQSNSDFQMYTLLDQAQMYIDFSAKGYYLQAYTKVLAELKLFGLSRGKINASLIPQVIEYKNADGSVNWAKTMENAGLDENGNPIYDDFEGINHTEAFMLIEDAEYSKNICGICIGYSDNHIRKLLDDNRVQQIIGFHDKTDNPEKRYRGAKYSKNYNGLNEAVKVKADGTEETVHVGFNQFVSKAEKMFKFNKKTETFEDTVNHNGKEYSANDIPRLAADLYLEMCAEKNYRPAYNDFSSHKNYYKLLADFGLYDSQGNYAPHQKVQYNMPDKVPYLDKNGNKAYMSTEAYIKAELQKELTVRDSISEALADTSKNGIIPQFVERVNALHTEKADTTLHSDRDSEGNELSKEQQEFFKDSKVRDENGNLLVVYHGSPKGNTTIFDKSVTSKDNDMGQGIYFSTNISDANEYRRKNNVGDMGKIYRGKIYSAYVNIENPFVVSESEKISLTDALNLLKLCEDRITAKDVWYDLNINAKDGYVTTSQFANSNISTHMTDILAKSNKYDGIIDETVATKFELKEGTKHIIVLDSNQIKETTNTKPTTDPDIRHSSRIEADMSEEKRYEILKDKKIQPQEIEIDKDFDIEFSFLENNIKSVVEKPLISKLQELGYLKKYTSNAIDVEFEFTGSGARKSIHSQENHYGGNLGDFAKVVLNMQKLLDNSMLLEIHTDKGKGTPRENPQLIQTYVLLSAFREGNLIKPVQFEVKQYVDNNNRLYLAVALTKIETGVKGNTIPQNEASTSLLPVSEISIADLFKNVNIKDAKFLKYAPDQFLSKEQIKAKERELENDRIKYSIQKNMLYSERDDSSVSTRTLLANALEGAAQNDIEKNKLAQYKEKIALIEAEQNKLHELREKLFTKGISGDERRKIQDEATRTANRINTYDRQLFNLESTTALKNVLNREKALAMKRQKQKDAENLKAYKEKVAETTRQLLEKNRESRYKAIEGRNKTKMRHKVKKIVNDLNNLLLKPTKERHVPEEMRVAVAEALAIINMDTVDAETRVARLNEKIAMANDPDVIASLTESRDRILEQGNKLGEKLKNLKEAYGMVRDSADNSLNSMYDDVIYNKIESVQKKVGKTPLRNMTLEQLESVYELYKMVLTTVRDSNKAFAENITMTRQALGSNTFEEIKENNKAKDRIRFEGVKKFGWKYLKPMLAMKTIGSETLQKLWNNILYGQEVFAQDYDEAVKFAKETKEKYGYDKWDLLKQYSFESKSGKVMKINLEQMMSIYAYSKRKQADEHIEFGGILLNESIIKEKSKLGKIVEVKVNDSTAYRLDKMQVGEIIATLEKEFPGAKDFVDEMQKYLSETMGEKGNEVSMKMYGIKLFKEEHYFPLKSSKEFMEAANAKLKGDVKIKNKGMTKSTVEHARNPIVLEGFLNVWGNHINEMAMYHGLVLPLEDFSRTLNYSFKADEKLNTDAESVKTALGSAFGESAENYLNELLKAINGGVLHDSSDGFANKMISNFKKSKVMASLSVIVQQPTAIIRAMGIIDPKYFVAQNFHHKTTWEELKKYCPTAIIKETGSFDTNMGRTIVDMVKDDRGFTDKVGDVLGKAPAYMDEVGWNMIWRALKKKVATEQNLSGEELLKECGRQMTLIINETQVYDSVMSRNELMRSKSALTKMATAFMGEPTTVANMIYGAALDIKRGKKGVAGKTIAAVISSVVINGLVSSLVYAFRDDDEEKTFLEKYLSSATTEVIDGFNPLTYIPFVKDAYSLFQGYDVERTDMALIGDVVDAIDDFYNVLDPEAYEGLSRKEIAKHIYENAKPLLTSICDMFGLPVGNILRDAEAIIVNDNLPLSKTSGVGTGLAIKDGLINASPKKLIPMFADDEKYQKLYLIANNGDSAYVKNEVAEMVAEKFDSYKAEEDSEVKAEKKAKQSVKSSFTATYRDEYKKAFKKKDANEMNRIRKFLYATGLWVSLRELDNLLTKWREEA